METTHRTSVSEQEEVMAPAPSVMTDAERRNWTDQCERFTDSHERIAQPTDFASCLFLSLLPYKIAAPALVFVFVLLTVLSLLINVFVLVTVSRSEDLSWQPRMVLLKNLILSDILQISNFGPAVIVALSRRRTIAFSFWCKAQYFVGTVSLFSSLLTITLMALERYLYVCRAIHYLVILTQMRLRLVLVLSWVYAFSISTVNMLLLNTGVVRKDLPVTTGLLCEPDTVEHVFGFPRASAVFRKVVGTLTLCVCLLFYLFSYVRMYKDARRAAVPFNVVNATARNTVLYYCGMLFLQLLPLLLKVASDSVWEIEGTVAMVAPPSPQSLLRLSPTPSLTATVLHLSLLVMLLVPPCINPLVYSLRNAEIRNELCKATRSWWDRRRTRREERNVLHQNGPRAG